MKNLFPFFIILFFACSETKTDETSTIPADTAQVVNQDYFPIQDFLKSEIAAVDSTPVGIKKYISSTNVNDSAYIKPEEFHQLALEFLPPALNENVFEKEFKETSFIDKATGGATFFYNTNNPNIDLKRADVITQKTDTYDKVKSIYLERSYLSGQNIITKKLYWKPERNFQIITITSKSGQDPETELIKVVWDNRE